MIETCRGFRFTAKTHEGVVGISVMGQNAFERDDAARMTLPYAINNAHSAAADLFQNLIIA